MWILKKLGNKVEGTWVLQNGQKVIVDGTEGAVYACRQEVSED